jgi:hypothetical protein
MTFTFVGKQTQAEMDPAGPLKKTPTGGEFDYFFWARGPEFLFTVARVTKVTNATEIECIFFNPDTEKELAMNAVTVKLDEVNAWPALPSTINDVNKIKTGAGEANIVILLIKQSWMEANVPLLDAVFKVKPSLFRKHPPENDGYQVAYNKLAVAVKELAEALHHQGGHPLNIPAFNEARNGLPPNLIPQFL